jgi:xanthine/CO dehydrogenase XdhC/CoxF family maturation factor
MKKVLDTGIPELKSYTLPDGLAEIFLERINPDIELIIFGAGFDVVPVLKLASELGWQVTVTEDCIAHLAPKRFSAATCIIYAERDAVLDKINITDRTAAVLMSHNYKYDIAVLEALLSTDIPYIGILGPLKRFEKMKDEYMKSGKIFSDSKLNQVHAPIGLDIGAETPDEIALSIISEIKAFFTHRPGSFLKNKKTPIHHRDEKYQ